MPQSGYGYVYILTNRAMPGLVKIGFTCRHPSARAAELTAATGVPAPFEVAWACQVSNCASVEYAVHRRLHHCRVSRGREFFRCDVPTARRVIEKEAAGFLGTGVRLWAPRPAPHRFIRRNADYSEGLCLLICIAVPLFIMLYQPVVPRWMPTGISHTIYALERVWR